MEKIQIKPLIILLISCLFLFNCSTSIKTSKDKSSNVKKLDKIQENNTQLSQITDIPIPPGTTLNARNSLILGSGDLWTGRLVMSLDQSHSEAFALFTTQMPQFGWQPITSVQSETSLLTFVRGNFLLVPPC